MEFVDAVTESAGKWRFWHRHIAALRQGHLMHQPIRNRRTGRHA